MEKIKDYIKKIVDKCHIKTIPIEDLKYLNELLKSNIPLKTCLKLIENNTNKKLFDELLAKLDKGEMMENIIVLYLAKDIGLYMKNLLKNLSFSNSLELALSFYDKQNENNKYIGKAIAYPIILLFISLTALFLFDSYGLDTILNLMKQFKTDVSNINVIRIFLRVLIYAFYIVFILVSIIILVFIKPKRITMFYILLVKYFPNSLVKTYFTEDFVSLFSIALKLGYKTKDALTILKSLLNKPVVSFLAFHIDDYLLKGESLKEASKQNYYDEVFSKFINVASYATNFTNVLENYINLSRNKIVNKMRIYASVLQASSYVVIGIVIIFIYQVLFLPMQAINSF